MTPFPIGFRHFVRTALAALLLGLAAGSSRAAEETPCPPVALVEGPAPIAGPTRAILREHGVRSQPSGDSDTAESAGDAPACRGRLLRASFLASADPGAYTLRIDDGLGRLSDREAADPETAASLIESWLLDEDAALLVPKPEPKPAAREQEPAAIARGAPSEPPPATAAAGWRLFGAGEVSTDSDATRWYGGSASACRSFGLICGGGRARLLRAQGWQNYYGEERNETGADALVLAAIPLRMGRVTIFPVAGIGVGVTRFVAVGDWDVMTRNRLFLRSDLSLILDVAIARRWSVFAEVGTSAAQQLGGDQREPSPGPTPGRGASDLLVRGAVGVGYAP